MLATADLNVPNLQAYASIVRHIARCHMFATPAIERSFKQKAEKLALRLGVISGLCVRVCIHLQFCFFLQNLKSVKQ